VNKLLAAVALALAAGAAGYFLARGSEHAVSLGLPPQPTTATQATTQTTGALPSARSLEVWFARRGRLAESLRTHRPTPRVATAAVQALLAGPTRIERAAGLSTQIPAGTRLNGISIANGVAKVDLTSEFEAGAGSRSLQLRLAQVVYTVTQFPTVKAVRFSIDGTPVNVFSGSGIVLGRPVGRSAYHTLAPVVSPLAGTWRSLPPSPVGPLTSRSAVWTGRELIVLGRAGGARTALSYMPARTAWRRLPAPSVFGRAAWTGKELLVWGSGLEAYSPSNRRWTRLPRPPVAGSPETIAWTGRELVGWTVYGGAAYRPATHRWRRLPPALLAGPSAWTGDELIVVSGARAAAFSPATGWRRLAHVPEPREGANVVWDGRELLVVGGKSAPAVGFGFDPATGSWRRLGPMESGRTGAAAVWTGRRLLLWGGETGPLGSRVIPPHGLAYDPKTDHWSPLPQAPLRGRFDPVGVWTGRSFIVWGGDPGFADGASFTPSR
jgi:Sporulation and spore germination